MSAFVPFVFLHKPQPRVVLFFFAGILPVSCIALHCAGILSLNHAFPFLVLPAVVLAFTISAEDKKLVQMVFRGWISGVIAVAVYDLSRIPFVYAGWDDFIPHIASWLTGKAEHSYLISYTWRYAGNGGGLGIVFFLLAEYFRWRKYSASAGVTFGLFVYIGLLALLIFFPDAQRLMFEITPVAFFGGLVGHLVYGYMIGRMYRHWSSPCYSRVTSREYAAAPMQ